MSPTSGGALRLSTPSPPPTFSSPKTIAPSALPSSIRPPPPHSTSSSAIDASESVFAPQQVSSSSASAACTFLHSLRGHQRPITAPYCPPQIPSPSLQPSPAIPAASTPRLGTFITATPPHSTTPSHSPASALPMRSHHPTLRRRVIHSWHFTDGENIHPSRLLRLRT